MEIKTKTETVTVTDLLAIFAKDSGDWFTMAAFMEDIGLPRGDGIGYTAAAAAAVAVGVLEMKRAVVKNNGLVKHCRHCSKLQQKPIPTQTSRPKIKRNVSVKNSWPAIMAIDFYASTHVAQTFDEFGTLEDMTGDLKRLTVDGRYDFQDVLYYVDEYDQRNA